MNIDVERSPTNSEEQHLAATPKARALGLAVRKERNDRSTSLRDLAGRIGRHSGEISRWENGERPLTPERTAQILSALGVSGDRFDEIMSLAYEAKNPPWVATTLPERERQLSALIDFEQLASRIIAVSPLLVPGLLQVPSYVRAIMTSGVSVPLNEVSARVALRLGRQEVVTRTDPVNLVVYLGEAVLHQTVGDSTVMGEQLRHLVSMQQRPNVALRLIPYRSGWNPALDGAFTLIESGSAAPIVQMENRRSTLLVHEDADIEVYRQAADQLDKLSFAPEKSTRTIAEMAQRWETTR
ncbi:helix-turn-helix transcriptional regulator [Saccharopolyspora sp. SCSIO 74807]|uniref:helix-turn-helix domain-containing protein n=1 Tax=Saccharopolyspora sp. SCSIO 74807 TaxID=3118084 RepID=UPI0030CDFA8A